MSQSVCLTVDLNMDTGWERRGAGHGSVTTQRENPRQRQAASWLVQGSGRGLEWPVCMSCGGSW